MDGEIYRFENSEKGNGYQIDYWLGITSIKDEKNWFFKNSKTKGERSGKNLGIITSYRWEEMHILLHLCLNISLLPFLYVACIASIKNTMVSYVHISIIGQKDV